jgi:dihydroneopterin aldolase
VTRTALQRVFVRGLRLEAEVGVHAHEHGRTQPLVFDVELDVALEGLDRLADVFDYEAVVSHARAVLAGGHVLLVEQAADRLARRCLDDGRVRRVRVRVEKPDAFAEADAAGFELVLER